MRSKTRMESIASFFRLKNTPLDAAEYLTRSDRFVAAQTLVTAFYAILFFFAAGGMFVWQGYLESTALTPRWPVFWLRFVDLRLGISLILFFHLAAGFLGLVFCRYRWARILVFLSLLEFLAFKFSFGSINHGDHLGVLLSFILIFLPQGWSTRPPPERSLRAATLLVFSATQGMIMLTYSMSGFWKIWAVITQGLKGEITALAPSALARHIAEKLLSSDTTSFLGPWFIEHYWVGWPLMLASLYLEFFALWAVARPSLHRLFGVGLILLHLSTHLTLNVGFAQNTLWLALFLVLSPFNPDRVDWRQSLRDLPLIGPLVARVRPAASKQEAAAS